MEHLSQNFKLTFENKTHSLSLSERDYSPKNDLMCVWLIGLLG